MLNREKYESTKKQNENLMKNNFHLEQALDKLQI